MEYDPFDLYDLKPDKSVTDRIKVFEVQIIHVRNKLVLDWIAYVYHPQTPLARITDSTTIDNYLKRKFIAAEEARFPKDLKTGRFHEAYEEIILNKNSAVNRMVVAYLKLWNSRVYSRLILQRDSYYNQLKSLMDVESMDNQRPDDIKKMSEARKAIQNTLDITESKLKELELELLQGDKNERLLMDLYQEIELESLGLRPEDIAIMLRDGKNPLAAFKPKYL